MLKIMSLNENKFILGKKTRKQILNDADNRFVEIVFGYAFGITALILLMIFSNSEIDELYIIIVLIGFVVISLTLHFLGRRCAFCDSIKGIEHYEIGGFTAKKGSFRCNSCNFSSHQIKEIIDMLERGVEINAETIARFNKRDL
jgi:hypothetical protein